MRAIALLALAATLASNYGQDAREADATMQAQVALAERKSFSRQAEFDHGCPADRVKYIRGYGRTIDLDVCGVVRRYMSQWQGNRSPAAWLDVTTNFPASSLPAPLSTARSGGAAP